MIRPRNYATAGAFGHALEERLKRFALIDRVDLNRLRRQASFDRLLARLFYVESARWAFRGGSALALRFKESRKTCRHRFDGATRCTPKGGNSNQILREMLQRTAAIPLDDWFEYAIGAQILDLAAAPYGGARFPVEARMDHRAFAGFHVKARVELQRRLDARALKCFALVY